MIREVEKCPKCLEILCHVTIKGENVFGCPECRREVSREDSIKVSESHCFCCKNWYNVEEGHCCCGIGE